ncbi:hypothetical protein ACROYT_G019477 [Oculina patagonica]
MASATKTSLSVSGTDSLYNNMVFIGRKNDHIHEEKVVDFDGNVVSQRAILMQASEQTAANEPTLSEVLKEDFLHKSRNFKGRTDQLNLCSTGREKISSKNVSRRILEDDFLERYTDESVPSTQFRAFNFQGRTTKHSVGTRPLLRNHKMPEKTDEANIASCLKNRKFEVSSEEERSAEAERMDKMYSRLERGDRDMKSQDFKKNLLWSSSPPVLNNRNGNGAEKNEKHTQRKVEKDSKQLKIVVNNLVSAISYSFQNALALKQQQRQEIDKSFLTFFLRREARKMFLIKELIKQLDANAASFKFYEQDLKDISETAESLHSLMCQDLKDPNEEEIKEISLTRKKLATNSHPQSAMSLDAPPSNPDVDGFSKTESCELDEMAQTTKQGEIDAKSENQQEASLLSSPETSTIGQLPMQVRWKGKRELNLEQIKTLLLKENFSLLKSYKIDKDVKKAVESGNIEEYCKDLVTKLTKLAQTIAVKIAERVVKVKDKAFAVVREESQRKKQDGSKDGNSGQKILEEKLKSLPKASRELALQAFASSDPMLYCNCVTNEIHKTAAGYAGAGCERCRKRCKESA